MVIQRSITSYDLIALGAVNEDWIAGTSRLSRSERMRFREMGPDIEWGQETVVSLEKFDYLKSKLPRVEWHQEMGGSAINVVDAMSRLRPHLRLGVVGVEGFPRRAAGKVPRIALGDRGVNVNKLREAPRREPMGQCMSIVDDRGERTLITSPCANRQICDVIDDDATIAYLASARVLHVTSLLDQRDGCEDAPATKVAEVLRTVRSESPGTIISFDPGFSWSDAPTPSVLAILEMADLVFFNLREFQAMSARLDTRFDETGTVPDPAERANAILARCGDDAAILVVKLTAATQIFSRRDGRTAPSQILHGPKVANDDIEDSTGAGDLFAAGVLATVASPKISGQLGVSLGMRFAALGLRTEGKASYDHLDQEVDRLLEPAEREPCAAASEVSGAVVLPAAPWRGLLMACVVLTIVLALVVACSLVFGPETGIGIVVAES